MVGGIPECLKCKHYNTSDLNGNTCTAYPDGIPVEIMSDMIDHREPYPGDNGIQFEPIADTKKSAD